MPEREWSPSVSETHSAVVLLLGDLAFKIKKPVDLGFLDFRTLESRRRFTYRELELNRRFSPDVYLDVDSLVGSDGRPREYVLVMRRMPDSARLSTRIVNGDAVDADLSQVARLMAAFHSGASREPEVRAEASAAGLQRRWASNLCEAEGYRGDLIDPAVHAELATLVTGFLRCNEEWLNERANSGLAMDGHGDLRADDIFCLPDGPRVLDCVEFDDRLRWVDVIDDIAFLAMDLEHLNRTDLATAFVSDYADFSGTMVPQHLLNHYVAYRALVRAVVSCIRSEQGDPQARHSASRYAALALRHARRAQSFLLLVGGPPGSGKTTLARGLAARLGCLLIHSDEVRQEVRVPSGEDRYSERSKDAVYDEMLRRGEFALRHGENVVLDATWGSPERRHRAERLAKELPAQATALECRVPLGVAAARAESRMQAGSDASQAGATVSRALTQAWQPWAEAHLVDTEVTPEESLAAALAVLPEPLRSTTG